MPPSAPWRAHTPSLWRHADFLKLWTGQTISIFGTLVTRFAVPLIAALLLGAGPAQMALLAAAEVAPGLAISMIAGVWVDHLRRRPILIAADLGRAVVLCSIPAAAVLRTLGMGQLYVVALIVSVLSSFFDVAYAAYLPVLIGREQLILGNSMLGASASVAEVAGWSIAGVLVQVLTAPLALLVDAASFVVSAFSVAAIRTKEPDPSRPAERRTPASEALQGLSFTISDPTRRALAGAGALDELFGNALGSVIILYLLRDLHLPPVLMGATFAVGGVSSCFGATLATPLARRLGLGRAMLLTAMLGVPFTFFVPLAAGPLFLATTLLVIAQLGDGARTLYMVSRLSLLQAVTPDHLQGRLHATIGMIEGAAALCGLFLGGVLGTVVGFRITLFIACAGRLLGLAWLLISPIRHLRELPVLETQPADPLEKAPVLPV